MIKAVLFDLDGTLLDTIDVFWQAFNAGVAGYNLKPVPRERIMALMNRGEKLHVMMNDVYPGLNIDENSPVLAAMRDEIRKRFNDGGVTLMKGARELLESIKSRGLKIAVVTSRTAPRERMMKELKDLDIDRYFDVVMTSAGAKRKPAPDTVFKCAEDLGVSCKEAVIVGDSNADIAAGKAAGMRTVAVADGVAFRHELEADSPDFIFRDLSSLISALDSILDSVVAGEVGMVKVECEKLFLFGAKAGSLEGYLFQREKVEPLANWVGHIAEMYRDLPAEMKKQVNPGFAEVLERALSYGEKSLEPALRQKLAELLREAKG